MTTTPTARAAAYVAAFDKAESALLDAHAIGGPAREREADEACRYLVSHFIDRLQPADVFPEPESAAPAVSAVEAAASVIALAVLQAGAVTLGDYWRSVARDALEAAFPALAAQVASLVAENERLRAMLSDKFDRETLLTGMDVAGGGLTIGLQGGACAAFAAAFAEQFDSSNAINYIEARFNRKDDPRQFLVTLQLCGNPTPHMLREAAEQQLAASEREVEKWRASDRDSRYVSDQWQTRAEDAEAALRGERRQAEVMQEAARNVIAWDWSDNDAEPLADIAHLALVLKQADAARGEPT